MTKIIKYQNFNVYPFTVVGQTDLNYANPLNALAANRQSLKDILKYSADYYIHGKTIEVPHYADYKSLAPLTDFIRYPQLSRL